jgi:peptidylprolyl isomerase
MPSEKRVRQSTARIARLEAERAAAQRARRRRAIFRWGAIAVVAALAVVGYAVLAGDDDEPETRAGDTTTSIPIDPNAYNNPELAAEVLERDPPDPEPPPANTPKDALEIETLIEGEGEGAKAGDAVTVHYVGKVTDGTVFDQSWDRAPFPVTNLGTASVIAGWNEGLIGVKVGERRRLVIGSEKAYGGTGQGEDIGPDAPLAFEIDVVDISRV